jgi:hypothetical protein
MADPRLLLPMVLLLAAGCSDRVEGELRFASGDDAVRVFAPADCASAEPLGFFGVDLWDDRARRFGRLVGHDLGPALIVFEPEPATTVETFRVGPDDCRVFDGQMIRTRTNAITTPEMEGSIEVDCDAPSGHRVEGSLHFERCTDFAAPDENDCDDDDWDDD